MAKLRGRYRDFRVPFAPPPAPRTHTVSPVISTACLEVDGPALIGHPRFLVSVRAQRWRCGFGECVRTRTPHGGLTQSSYSALKTLGAPGLVTVAQPCLFQGVPALEAQVGCLASRACAGLLPVSQAWQS